MTLRRLLSLALCPSHLPFQRVFRFTIRTLYRKRISLNTPGLSERHPGLALSIYQSSSWELFELGSPPPLFAKPVRSSRKHAADPHRCIVRSCASRSDTGTSSAHGFSGGTWWPTASVADTTKQLDGGCPPSLLRHFSALCELDGLC